MSESVEEDEGQGVSQLEVLKVLVDRVGGEDTLRADKILDNKSVKEDAIIKIVKLINLILYIDVRDNVAESSLQNYDLNDISLDNNNDLRYKYKAI